MFSWISWVKKTSPRNLLKLFLDDLPNCILFHVFRSLETGCRFSPIKYGKFCINHAILMKIGPVNLGKHGTKVKTVQCSPVNLVGQDSTKMCTVRFQVIKQKKRQGINIRNILKWECKRKQCLKKNKYFHANRFWYICTNMLNIIASVSSVNTEHRHSTKLKYFLSCICAPWNAESKMHSVKSLWLNIHFNSLI